MITFTREEAQQPEALRLADWHKAMADEPKRNESKRDKHRRTEAELRCLHEENKTLRAKLNEPEPEPELDKYLMEIECTKCGAKQDGILTVNAPPQREWVGLTDEEARELCVANVPYVIDMVRALEAKLKEKNSG